MAALRLAAAVATQAERLEKVAHPISPPVG